MVVSICRGRHLVAAGVAALAVLMATASQTGASQADYTQAYALGLQAYTYGLPLLETNKTFLSMTSINVSNGTGYGPVNQFNSVRQLNSPTSKAVVAPGANALSSIAWLDLRTDRRCCTSRASRTTILSWPSWIPIPRTSGTLALPIRRHRATT